MAAYEWVVIPQHQITMATLIDDLMLCGMNQQVNLVLRQERGLCVTKEYPQVTHSSVQTVCATNETIIKPQCSSVPTTAVEHYTDIWVATTLLVGQSFRQGCHMPRLACILQQMSTCLQYT